MICYKGFNQNLCCTMGRGTMQYEVGKTYTAESAKTANTGLHCVEEPIEVLRWYPDGRYCIVAAEGDINESDDKIACTQMRILKEILLFLCGGISRTIAKRKRFTVSLRTT